MNSTSLVFSAAVASVCSLASLAQADSDYFYLVSKHSDKCAHVFGASLSNDAAVTLWACVNQTNVKFKKVDTGDGDDSFFLVAKHSDSCVHVQGEAMPMAHSLPSGNVSTRTMLNGSNTQPGAILAILLSRAVESACT